MTRPLRILHVDPELDWGGGEAQVFELTRYLHRKGHFSRVATPPTGMLATRMQRESLPFEPLSVRNNLDGFAGLRLRSLTKAGRYDLIHFHTSRAHALCPWLYRLPLARLVTKRMDYAVARNPITTAMYIKSVDMVIAISPAVRATLITAGVPRQSIRLIPSGINTSLFAPNLEARKHVRTKHGIKPETTVVLSVGGLVKRKSHKTLIDAAARVTSSLHFQKSTTDTASLPHYIVCGRGPLENELKTQVDGLGLAPFFHFAGFCADIPSYLAAADIFVHVPTFEGLGVSVIEALAAGLPVACSRVGGIPELVTHDQSGLLVPPQDPACLETALLRLLNNPGWARSVGAIGQKLVRHKFGIETTVRANESLYYELTEKFAGNY